MKKTFFMILYISLITPINGQVSKYLIGFDIHPTTSWLYGEDNFKDFDNRISFSAGLCFEYISSEIFSIKTGLFYERKGAKTKVIITNAGGFIIGKTILSMNYDYLTIPLLFTISTPIVYKIEYFLDFGPALGFLVSQKYITDEVANLPELTDNNTNSTSPIDIGLIFGFGINFVISEDTLLNLILRDNIGLINTNQVGYDVIKTNLVSLIIGFNFFLPHK